MISFLLSGFIAIILAFAYALMGDEHLGESNSLDDWVLRLFQKYPLWHLRNQRLRWRPVLQKVVLELSDQQILLGIAMLFAGLLQRCTITEYHFSMVLNLAWMSCSVHITTLMVQKDYLKDKPKLRKWKVFLMALMFATMVSYQVLVAHDAWNESGPYPAQCLFNDLPGNVSGTSIPWLTFNLFSLLVGYSIGLLSLFGSLSSAVDTWVVQKPVSRLEKWISKLRLWRQKAARRSSKILYVPRACTSIIAEKFLLLLKSVYLLLITLTDSTWASLVYSAGFFVYGTLAIWRTRASPPADMEGNENELTFGQIIPLCMLASIIVVFKQAFEGKPSRTTYSNGGKPLTRRSEQRAMFDAHENAHEHTPLIDKLQRRGSDPPNVHEAIEMSGALVDIDDEARSMTAIPRHIDLEAAGGTMSTNVEASDSEEEPKRRTTFPLRSLSRADFN